MNATSVWTSTSLDLPSLPLARDATEDDGTGDRVTAHLLLIGAGGLGCSVLKALAPHGPLKITLVDDDTVDRTNLHRQVLFTAADIGAKKGAVARQYLVRAGFEPAHIRWIDDRFIPENAETLLTGVNVLVEGSDNFATKFLAADAAHLSGVPVVHGAALGWKTTAMLARGGKAGCYRCVFEDVPDEPAASCESAGVLGPVVALGGAVMAQFALEALSKQPTWGQLWHHNALTGRGRTLNVSQREDCHLCGLAPRIKGLCRASYA